MKSRIWLCRLAAAGFVLVLACGCTKDEEVSDIITDEDGNAYARLAGMCLQMQNGPH